LQPPSGCKVGAREEKEGGGRERVREEKRRRRERSGDLIVRRGSTSGRGAALEDIWDRFLNLARVSTAGSSEKGGFSSSFFFSLSRTSLLALFFFLPGLAEEGEKEREREIASTRDDGRKLALPESP